MKKNLLYFSIDINYIDCLNFNLKLLNKYQDFFDICLILPENIKKYYKEEYITHIIKNYDKFYTKIEILNYENYENYENFLYLDSDAFVVDNICEIFETINSDKKHIHGVKEKLDINKNINDYYFRFSDKIYEYNDLFNYGTFGFNIEMTNSLKEFKYYIEKYINNAKIDQALYNEFFAGEKRNILPTLSEYVYLGEMNNSIYKNINQIDYDKAKIIHFLGNYCNNDIKLKKAKLYLSKFL
jgi:hypothetical protein